MVSNFRLVLWNHVSGTSHSGKCEPFVLSDESANLPTDSVRSPLLNHSLVNFFNPAHSPRCGYSKISISRNFDHFIFIAEGFPDPLGASLFIVTSFCIVFCDIQVAIFPSLDIIWDVKGFSHITTIKIFSQWSSICAYWLPIILTKVQNITRFRPHFLLEAFQREPGGHIFKCGIFFVSFEVATYHCQAKKVCLGADIFMVAVGIHVIDIDLALMIFAGEDFQKLKEVFRTLSRLTHQ